MHDFARNPARFARKQIVAFDPGNRSVGIEPPTAGAQPSRIDNRFRARQNAVGGVPAAPDLLGVEAFAGLHQR